MGDMLESCSNGGTIKVRTVRHDAPAAPSCLEIIVPTSQPRDITVILRYGDGTGEEFPVEARQDGKPAMFRFEHRYPSIGDIIDEDGILYRTWEWGVLACSDDHLVKPGYGTVRHKSVSSGAPSSDLRAENSPDLFRDDQVVRHVVCAPGDAYETLHGHKPGLSR